MKRLFPALAATCVLVVTALLHGQWTGRWDVDEEKGPAAEKLERLPLTVGDWQGEAVTVDAREVPGASGYLFRRYIHPRNHKTLSISVVAGRPGFVAVHTPDMCFAGGGFELIAPPVTVTPRLENYPGEASFYVGKFRKAKLDGEELVRVFWSWSATGAWQAPDSPRIHFARCPTLYKLYVVEQMDSMNENQDEDACVAFLDRLLPELSKALFEPR